MMAMSLLWTFVFFNILNVVIQTFKTIATIKGGKTVAALVNALAYGLYTYIIILTSCDLPIITKAVIVGLCNLVGVWVVKWIEELVRKDKIWRVELTANPKIAPNLCAELKEHGIPFNYIPIEKYTIFNLYCATQKESAYAKELCEKYKVKYFVTESKDL